MVNGNIISTKKNREPKKHTSVVFLYEKPIPLKKSFSFIHLDGMEKNRVAKKTFIFRSQSPIYCNKQISEGQKWKSCSVKLCREERITSFWVWVEFFASVLCPFIRKRKSHTKDERNTHEILVKWKKFPSEEKILRFVAKKCEKFDGNSTKPTKNG
jgi:hypothetical protein